MENHLNKLLARQIKKHFGAVDNLPKELLGVIEDINNTYFGFEDDTQLLQNSIEISSQELRDAFQKHKNDAEVQKDTINKIKEAIFALNPSDQKSFNVDENTTSDSKYLFDSLIKLIEERNQAIEETLKLSKAVEQNPASIVITDVDGIIEYVNPKFCSLTGYKKEEVIGKNPNILKSGDRPVEHFKDLWKTILAGKEWRGDMHNKKKNGDLYWEFASISPIMNDNNKITHFIAIKEDITERRLMENKLKESEDLQRSLLENVAVGIMIIDPDTRIIERINPFAALLIGESEELIVGRECHQYICPAQENTCPVCDKGQTVDNSERVLICADKTELAVLKTVKKIQIGGKEKLVESFVDISVQKKAEEALLQSIQQFEAIITASPDGIGMVSLDGKLQLMSEKLAEMHGYTLDQKDEYSKKTIFDFIDSSDHKLLNENIHKLLSSKKDQKITEYLAIRKDNTRFNCDVNSAVLRDSKGNPSAILFVERDITERKLAEEELKRHAGLISSLLDSIPDLIFFKDVNGVYLGGNPAFSEFSNRPKDEIAGITDYDLFDKKIADSFLKHDQKIMDQRISSHNDVWTTYPDGHKVLFDTLKTPYLGPDGSLIGILGISRDITERKKAEDKLKEISTRLALATRAGGVGVWDKDIINNTMIWDDQMFVLYGVEKTTYINANDVWCKGIHPDDKTQRDEEVEMAINGEKEYNTEFRVVWPDNSVHNIRALAIVQRDEAGSALRMIGTNWDITEQKNTEAGLLKTKQEAEMANRAKSIFLANMSHEIRTPLNAIIGFSQLMNRENLLTDSQKEYNASIIRAGEHLLSLINDILELSKVEAGRVVLNPTNIDLHMLLKDMQMIFKERTESKNLQLIFEIADDLPQYVVIDENKLRQIFINLIGNAVKFTEHGGIAVRAKVVKTITGEEHKYKLIVEIQDSGYGIPQEELGNLFKHFVQTTSGIKKGSGTGLGLALSRELAVLMGGEITVSSQLGKGSTFILNVEIKEGNLETVKGKNIKRVLNIDKGEAPCRILVVDDKEENLQVATSLLKLVGFETKEAINGADAIIKFEEWNPHLILMDIRMPVMDGYEATRIIKQTEKGKLTPIVALTASTFEEDHQKAEMLNMQGYISKPFRENELFSTIEKILGIKYVYDDVVEAIQEKYHDDDEEIVKDIIQLSNDLVSRMLDAIAVADMDTLIELINNVGLDNSKLATYLMTLANNYEYENLKQLLKIKT